MQRKPVDSTPEFDNQVKALPKPKKYPKLPSDLKSFKQKLSVGEISRKRARDVDSAPVYGARVKDSSTGTGKSGGFRVLYFEGEEKCAAVHRSSARSRRLACRYDTADTQRVRTMAARR